MAGEGADDKLEADGPEEILVEPEPEEEELEDLYQQDVQRLLGIFPEEVWILILNQVKDPSVLEKVSNSSLYFRQLLEPKRVAFLFSKVFQALAPKIGYGQDGKNDPSFNEEVQVPSSAKSTEDDDDDDGSSNSGSLVGPLPPWYSMILKMRQVCSEWQQGVDHYYANHWTHYQLDHDHYDKNRQYCEDPEAIQEISWKYLFWGSWRRGLSDFVAHFKTTHEASPGRNPFLGRTLILSKEMNSTMREEEIAEELRFWNELPTTLLQPYGHHIWHFEFSSEDDLELRMDFIRRLNEWLGLLPNLRSLKISDWFGEDRSDLTREELETYLSDHPFPRLDHLIFLKVDGFPSLAFNNLLERNNHLRKLEVRKMHLGHNLYSIPLINLEELSLSLDSEEDLTELEAASVNWPELKTLYLPFYPDWFMAKVGFNQWTKLVTVVNQKWGQSTRLTNVMIQFPPLKESPKKYLNKSAALRLNLPSVQRIKLVLGSPCSLDLLLPMKDSLKLLDLQMKYLYNRFGEPVRTRPRHWFKTRNQVGLTEIYGWENKLLKSNLWTEFPKLEKMTKLDMVETWRDTVHYKREEWELEVQRRVEKKNRGLFKRAVNNGCSVM